MKEMKLDRGHVTGNPRSSTTSGIANRRPSLDRPRRPSINRSRRRSSVAPVFLPRRQQDEDPRPPSIVKRPFLLPSFTETGSENEPLKAENSNGEETLKEKRIGFKGLAKAILKQGTLSNLLRDIAMKQSDDHTRASGFVAKSEDGQERLSFNLNAFRPHVQSCGTLPNTIKEILSKMSFNRTNEDVEIVLQIVKKLKCFDRYPMYVKRELAKVLYYDCFDRERVIIKQGHVGISFYFIVTGTVSVHRIEEDKIKGGHHVQIVGEMSEGDSFGELALLHNTRRTATIICKERSEFLRVDKLDFDEVLKKSHQIDWGRKLSVLNSHPVFQNWNDRDKKHATMHTRLQEYPPNTIILSDTKDQTRDYMYFIHSGRCKVVRSVTLINKLLPSGGTRLLLPPVGCSKPRSNSHQKVERKFLTLRTLEKGDFFGVGEDLTNTYIIADGWVNCVLINHIVFRKKERGKTLDEMKQELDLFFPTEKQAFTSYMQERNWKLYKKKLIDEVVSRRKKPHSTTFEDVPTVVRTENPIYFENS